MLWLWRRPAAAAPIQPLVWELPYAMTEALKKAKKRPVREMDLYCESRNETFKRLHNICKVIALTEPGCESKLYDSKAHTLPFTPRI